MKQRKKRETEKKKTPVTLWLFGAVSFSFLLSLFVGQGGMLRLREMRAHADQMLLENYTLAIENRKLSEDIRQLRQNQEKIEKIAREELHFTSPRDLVLLVPK
jgi:cell division protein FtsB